jgi:hypothetical protein
VSGGVWRLLALGLGLTVLAGCGGPDERLVELDARIKALDGQMELGEVREVPLPPIKQGEWVVAINGQYVGSVCDPSPLSKEASLDASNYGSKGYPAFLLLVAGSRVRSDFPLSLAYTAVSPAEKSRWTCALIAGPTHRALVVECMKPVSDKASGRACEVVLRAVK